MTVGTDEIYFGGDNNSGIYNPGSYTVEVRAWADNNVDTEEFVILTVNILDPCEVGTLTLTIDDSIFKPSPQISLTQFVNYDALSITWTDSIISSSITTAINPCGTLNYKLWDLSTGSR